MRPVLAPRDAGPLEGDADLPELPPPVAAAAIRVLAEALSNCERHAGAAGAVLEARRTGERLELVVQDDGCGFASAPGRARAISGCC